MTMELQVLKNEQSFKWNFEEVKQKLSNDIQQYSNLVVSETNLAEMEKTQREIASLRTGLQKFRLAVKKDLEKPYQAFELQVKELAGLVESAERPIKDQIQKYEDDRRDKKCIEVQALIYQISEELGLSEKYSSQIIVADKYLNRGQKANDTREDIQQRVCWLLDIQAKEIADEAARIKNVNMAKMMCEFMSKELVTPLTFEDVENKIDSFNITELRTYIENQVAIRKEREERAKHQALEQEEQRRIAEIARQEREEQERIERERKQAEHERNQNIISESQTHIENVQRLAEANKPPEPIIVKPTDKLYNAQFVVYGVTQEQINDIGELIAHRNIDFKHSVKAV